MYRDDRVSMDNFSLDGSPMYTVNIADLKKLLRNNLFLDLDSHALSFSEYGLVCDFLGIRLTSVFQPIIAAADNRVLGREAFLRSYVDSATPFTAEGAFERAERARSLVQFDRLLRTLHLLNHARSFDPGELLFLNVDSRLLTRVQDHGRTFEQILHYYSVPPELVVIEIAERKVNEKQLHEAVKNFRNVGYKIAIDDIAPDLVSLNRVLNLKPDFVKLTGNLIQRAERISGGKGIVYGLVDTFHAIGAKVIIQGIETAAQVDIALRSGADGLQGFYNGRPAEPAGIQGSLCVIAA
jgi:EAL domain-containing protein (putative c-di-GMP-specific phosphodiesterase class I)